MWPRSRTLAPTPSSRATGAIDLLLLVKAASDSGFKGPLPHDSALTRWGNIAAAGDNSVGHYTVQHYFPDANGDKGCGHSVSCTRSKVGDYPYNVQGDTVNGGAGSGRILEGAEGQGGRQGECQEHSAWPWRKVTVESSMGTVSMRREDHQAMTPRQRLPSWPRDAKFKFDKTDKGFKDGQAGGAARTPPDPCRRPARLERPAN